MIESVGIPSRTAAVAGHLCLDIIPNPIISPRNFRDRAAGSSIEIGPAAFSTGGAVSNTGLALHRLGIETCLIARVGADPFGKAVCDLIESHGPGLSGGIRCDPHAGTSYTLILSPPGTDRIFLHYPGANDTFNAADVDYDRVAGVDLFHFGYPNLLKQMYQDGGAELSRLLKLAKKTGATVSLDTSFPDPTSESGRADWVSILRLALPHADLFLPSIEELLYMLRRDTYHALLRQAGGAACFW
jgi:sugar/nucleoside kinase (ribokinase family)